MLIASARLWGTCLVEAVAAGKARRIPQKFATSLITATVQAAIGAMQRACIDMVNTHRVTHSERSQLDLDGMLIPQRKMSSIDEQRQTRTDNLAP